MGKINLNGNIIDSSKLKKEDDLLAMTWDVVNMHFHYQTLSNKTKEMPKWQAAWHSGQLVGMREYIEGKLRDYPRIREKSQILRRYYS